MSAGFVRIKGEIEFPEPRDININMMPFIMGDLSTIPEEYRHYSSLIDLCLQNMHHWDTCSFEIGKVGYLTIHESLVSAGESQRRPGLHTDGHINSQRGNGQLFHRWGGLSGGIYIASNVSNTAKVWDCCIEQPGELGDCEAYRIGLGEGDFLEKNIMYWITDRTPHEALPVEVDTYRQFFRLVTHEVDLWYSQHSTPNPLGIVAPCKIISENKFALDPYILK